MKLGNPMLAIAVAVAAMMRGGAARGAGALLRPRGDSFSYLPNAGDVGEARPYARLSKRHGRVIKANRAQRARLAEALRFMR